MRFLFLLLIFWPNLCFSQKQSYHWYFDENAGLKFTNGIVDADTNSNDSSTYIIAAASNDNNSFKASDVASISHPTSGELLFYASSIGVFNRNHHTMPNGFPLHTAVYSNQNAAEQGALIVPRPNKENQYYFFYLRSSLADIYDDGITAGLFYNLIDMTLDNGLGDVADTVKNIYLTDSTDEKITATPHANGVDYWVMVRRSCTNKHLAFLVTENGVVSNPVISSIGLPSCGTSTIGSDYGTCEGYLKFNHEGNMLAHTRLVHYSNWTYALINILDFDNNTGTLSNSREIDISSVGQAQLGLEFSPDDSKLYAGGPTQFDLTVPTQSAIQGSMLILNTTGPAFTAGLQMGPDGKIYGNTFFTATSSFYMDCIHNPNALGVACNYQDSAVYLQGKLGGINVPQFLPNFFKINFYADTVCVGEPTQFNINFTFIDSVFWNFGDPSSGALNTDTAISPSHVYATAGTYTVMLIAQNGVRTDTVYKTITVKTAPQIDLGADVELCCATGDSVKLSIGGKEGNYAWSNGTNDSILWIHSTANSSLCGSSSQSEELRWLTFTDECGTDADTVLIVYSQPLAVNLPPDTSICSDTFIIVPSINSSNSLTKYLWNTGQTGQSIQVTHPLPGGGQGVGLFSLTAINACGSDSDSITITFLAKPDGFLPQDSVYCSSIPFYILNNQSAGITYTWPNGDGGPQYRLDTTGTYWLRSSSLCDTLVDSFYVYFNGAPTADLGIDSSICPGDVVALRSFNLSNAAASKQTYSWSTGDTSSIVYVSDTGWYSVTATLDLCSTKDSMRLTLRGDCYERCKPAITNVITPNGDGLNDVFVPEMKCNPTQYRLQVFNRWGTVVFETNGLGIGWDGTINGTPASEGVYYFDLRYTAENSENERIQRGSVQVMQ